ncbi:MAG: hypothetical protein WD595_00030 [Waddliaceae bacterium]
MSELILRAFNLDREDAKSTLLFCVLCYVWSFAITLGMKYSDSLFILQIGSEYLPATYRYESLGMILLSAILVFSYSRYPVIYIFRAVIVAALLFYSFVSFCFITEIGTQTRALWFALNVFGTQLFTVGITAIWTLIDYYYETHRAKRLFGMFSSMIFMGAITTGIVMRTGLLNRTVFTILMTTIVLFTGLWISLISSKMGCASKTKNVHYPFSLSKLVNGIAASKFAKLVIVANLLTFLLWVITEYNYLQAFEMHFQRMTNEQQSPLPQFMGLCISIVGIFNLIFGLFFYSRAIERYGIWNVLLYTPTLFLVMFCGWYLYDLFLFPLIGVFIVEGTLYVIDDSNFSLLVKKLPPSYKNQVRVLIESFFEPIGMLISGIILSVPYLNSKFLGLIFAILLFIVVLALKSTIKKETARESAVSNPV